MDINRDLLPHEIAFFRAGIARVREDGAFREGEQAQFLDAFAMVLDLVERATDVGNRERYAAIHEAALTRRQDEVERRERRIERSWAAHKRQMAMKNKRIAGLARAVEIGTMLELSGSKSDYNQWFYLAEEMNIHPSDIRGIVHRYFNWQEAQARKAAPEEV